MNLYEIEHDSDAEKFANIEALQGTCFVDPWKKEMMAEMSKLPVNRFLVAEEEGEFAGFCIFACVEPEIEIYKLAVSEKFRKRGFASKMLEYIFNLEGCDTYYLEARASNKPARALYEKTGFYMIGERTKYYKNGEDAVIYKRGPKA